MIEINDLSYRYGRHTEALHNLTLSIQPGIHLLLGENGSGKTTLLHIIAGLRRPMPEDSCLIDDTPSALREPSVMNEMFILTDSMTFPYRSINEMVRYHAPFYPRFDSEMLYAILRRFDMTGAEPFDRFSLGNRKKAQLAYVLALRTRYLMLDEPANGLDITSRNELMKLLAEYTSDDQTIIISTHTVFDFQNIVDSVIVLNRGYALISMPVWKITERLAFVSEPLPVDGALYMDQALGRFNAILPNQGSVQTNIDFVLLFKALQSPQSQTLLSILNS